MTVESIKQVSKDMSYDTNSLLNFYKYPNDNWQYVSDVVDQTIQALEDISKLEDLECNNSELFSLLPCEDELDEEVDILTDILDMKKDDMIENIKDVITRLKAKSEGYERTREMAEKDYT